MNPVAVLANLEVLGGTLPRTYVVGCVPADLSEGIGLTDVVTAALDEALATVRGLVAELQVGV
jgi:hydrogenase maturation protease